MWLGDLRLRVDIFYTWIWQLWHIVIDQRPWLACKPVGHWHSLKRGSQLHRASHLHLHNFFATKRSNLSLFFSIIFSQQPKKLELLVIAQRETANSKIGQNKCWSTQMELVYLEIPEDEQNTKSAQPPIWQMTEEQHVFQEVQLWVTWGGGDVSQEWLSDADDIYSGWWRRLLLALIWWFWKSQIASPAQLPI